METYNTELAKFIKTMGFEEMESGVFRKDNLDICVQVIEHVDGLDDVKKENKSIRIPVTDNDIEELRDGGSFDWSFPVEGSADSEWIDVELVNDNEEQL